MSHTTDVPGSVTTAGQDFSYATWPAQSQVKLLNVPWNNDYRDIVQFPTEAAFVDYMASLTGPEITLTNVSYLKFGMPIQIPVPFNKANRYNYIYVQNAFNPSGDNVKAYPYFITSVEYVNASTTRIHVQLDVWQAFSRDVAFGRGYIERGHIGIAHDKASGRNGRDYLTVPEGLDVGGEYMVRDVVRTKLDSIDEGGANGCSIIVVSSVDFNKSGGDTSNPTLESASGARANLIPNGADVYYFSHSGRFELFLRAFADKPWVTQGIMAAYMVPRLEDSEVEGITVSNVTAGTSGVGWECKKITGYPRLKTFTGMAGWRTKLFATLPARYKVLTKLMTYPYTFIEATMHNGMPLVLKPECLPDYKTQPDLRMVLARMITPPNPRLMLYPKDYNSDSTSTDNGYADLVTGEFLDFATGITNLPQISVVNNMYANYLASNNAQIQYQHNSADWSQQRVMQSAQTSYDQASGQISTNESLNQQQVAAANTSMELQNHMTTVRALSSGTGAVLSGAARGGIPGAAGSFLQAGVGWAADTSQNTQQTAINNRLSTGRMNTANQQGALVRDTNMDFASFASKGDYQNSIAGINARVQDAKMIQPTISGQMGGDAFNYSVMQGFDLSLKIKQVDANAMAAIGEFWLRYGYAVNRFHNLGSQLLVMSNFTYWKVKELYLTSSRCPETFRQTIRGIFEKGVTVWANPNDISTLDVASNIPKTGITL